MASVHYLEAGSKRFKARRGCFNFKGIFAFNFIFRFIAPVNFHQTAKAFSQRTLAAKIRWLIDTSLVVCQLYTDKKLFFIPTGHTFTAKVLRHWARFCFYFRFYYYPPPPPSSSLSYCFLKQSPAGKKSQHLLWYMSQT